MTLQENLQQYGSLLARTGNASEAALVERAQERLNASDFRVLLVGDYARGKSSLLNALLGEKVFATSVVPLATINTARFGSPGAIVTLEDGSTQTLTLDQLRESDTEYRRVTVTLEHDLLRPDIEFIEYPSMTDAVAGQPPLIDLLATCDLVVIVLASDALYAKTESDVVNDVIIPAGHTHLFFVSNRFDRVGDEGATVREHGTTKLRAIEKAHPRIFFTSATTGEGVDELMLSLRDFLGGDLAAVKRERAKAQATNIAAKLTPIFAERIDALNIDIGQTAERPAHARNLRERVGQRRANILRQVNDFKETAVQLVTSRAENFVTEVAVDAERRLRENPALDLNVYAREIQARFKQWYETDLLPFIDERIVTEFSDRVKPEIDGFMRELERLADTLDIDETQRTALLDTSLDLPSTFDAASGDFRVPTETVAGTAPARKTYNLSSEDLIQAVIVGAVAGAVGWFIFWPIGIPLGVAAGTIYTYQKQKVADIASQQDQAVAGAFVQTLHGAGGEQTTALSTAINDLMAQFETSLRSFFEVRLALLDEAIETIEKAVAAEIEAKRVEVGNQEVQLTELNTLAEQIGKDT